MRRRRKEKVAFILRAMDTWSQVPLPMSGRVGATQYLNEHFHPTHKLLPGIDIFISHVGKGLTFNI